ncbi:hypothetical protein Tco_0831617 [Tanacetum coccineum]
MIPETTNLSPIPEILTETLVSTAVSSPHVTPTISTLQNWKKDVFELKKLDLSAEALAALKTQVPSIVDNYFGSKVGDVFQKELKKHTADLIHKYSLQQIPELPKNQTPTVDLEQESKKNKVAVKEFDQKSALYQTMHANKSFNRNPANHRLYHALMEALIEDENGKKTKRKRTKESKSSKKPSTTKETPKGKALSKDSKTGKSASTKEAVKEPTAEVVMVNAGKDVVRDDDQPQDTSEPKTSKTLNPESFTQPPRPPTPDPKWNKHKLDWNNPEGDRYPFDLSKPLPLQEKTYTTSIMKTKAARYEIEGIEDIVPMLWSPTKVGYDKYAFKGIKH